MCVCACVGLHMCASVIVTAFVRVCVCASVRAVRAEGANMNFACSSRLYLKQTNRPKKGTPQWRATRHTLARTHTARRAFIASATQGRASDAAYALPAFASMVGAHAIARSVVGRACVRARALRGAVQRRLAELVDVIHGAPVHRIPIPISPFPSRPETAGPNLPCGSVSVRCSHVAAGRDRPGFHPRATAGREVGGR
jgi:hypothetical protein